MYFIRIRRYIWWYFCGNHVAGVIWIFERNVRRFIDIMYLQVQSINSGLTCIKVLSSNLLYNLLPYLERSFKCGTSSEVIEMLVRNYTTIELSYLNVGRLNYIFFRRGFRKADNKNKGCSLCRIYSKKMSGEEKKREYLECSVLKEINGQLTLIMATKLASTVWESISIEQ